MDSNSEDTREDKNSENTKKLILPMRKPYNFSNRQNKYYHEDKKIKDIHYKKNEIKRTMDLLKDLKIELQEIRKKKHINKTYEIAIIEQRERYSKEYTIIENKDSLGVKNE